MAGKKALVLSGGSVKGCWQAGAIKASEILCTRYYLRYFGRLVKWFVYQQPGRHHI